MENETRPKHDEPVLIVMKDGGMQNGEYLLRMSFLY
jgi:hypothetical protein